MRYVYKEESPRPRGRPDGDAEPDSIDSQWNLFDFTGTDWYPQLTYS
jgi:hypothetical protein